MTIEELNGVKEDKDEGSRKGRLDVSIVAKGALIGAGGRILFYPTLWYNVLRNKIQTEYRWWDEIDQFILLGAVPFPKDVPKLKQLGVSGVITLNEPYETLVPSSLYQEYGMDHLVIPTRDYFFAPSPSDISRAVEFIHRKSCLGQTTYVHCKAGRGRSTTVVLCYLVEHKQMTPSDALEYVRSRRPRIRLHHAQWKAVEDYSKERQTALSTYDSQSSSFELITEADPEGCCEDNRESKQTDSLLRRPIARLTRFFASLRNSRTVLDR